MYSLAHIFEALNILNRDFLGDSAEIFMFHPLTRALSCMKCFIFSVYNKYVS